MELLDYRYECKNALEFSRSLPDNSVKLIITSPPYNIGKEYETKKGIDEYIEDMQPMLFGGLFSKRVRSIN